MTTAEVARRLGVSPTTVRTWAASLGLTIARNARGHREYGEEDLAALEAAKESLAEGEAIGREAIPGKGDLPKLVDFFEQQIALSQRLEKMLARLEEGERLERSRIVSGVLKQLFSRLLEAQGKLVPLTKGPDRIEYLAPGNVRHVVEIVCRTPEERRLLDSVTAMLGARTS